MNADGTMTQPDTAFYGDYEAVINGQDYPLTFSPSTNSYVLTVPEPATLAASTLGFLLMFRRPSKRSRDLCALPYRVWGKISRIGL
jgi:hypothetical protein